jgi:hypothetical protein
MSSDFSNIQEYAKYLDTLSTEELIELAKQKGIL